MNEDSLSQTLDDSVASLDVPPPPMEAMFEHATRVRRGRMAVLGAVLAMVVIAGVGFSGVLGGSEDTPLVPGVVLPEDSDAQLEPPQGFEFVGRGRAVVSVPDSWIRELPSCADPASGYVTSAALFVHTRCPSGKRDALRFFPYTYQLGVAAWDEYAEVLGTKSFTPDGAVSGREVLAYEGYDCTEDRELAAARDTPPLCRKIWAVPSENLVLTLYWVGTEGPALQVVQDVRSSLRLLPSGYMTVPPVEPGTLRSEAEATLEEAGLVAVTDAPDFDAPVIGTAPMFGSVVPVGARVTLLLDTGSATSPSETMPVAPEGMKLAGIKNVVVAVPTSWGNEKTNCGQPTQDTVYFGEGRHLQCRVSQRGISSVLLLDLDSEYGAEVAESATTSSEIDGLDVLRGPPECGPTDFCAYYFSEIVVLPEQGVVLATPFGGKESGVLDTVQLLPEGYTTVPFLDFAADSDDALDELAQADLNGQLEEGPDCCPHYVVGSDPEAGSVVPVGSEVTVLLGEG